MANHYVANFNEEPKAHYQRPVVDNLFDSAVKAGAAPHAPSLILTGMGSDGAAGMLNLKNAGGQTVAQDEKSCLVFGMPRAAIQKGAAQKILPLDQMAAEIERYATALSKRAA